VLDQGSRPRPPRRVLAGVAVGLAAGFCPLLGVVGALAASLLMHVVARASGPVTLLLPASVGGLIGALCGWAVSGWRWSEWAWLTAVAVAVATVAVPELLFGRQNERVGTVVWMVVLVSVLYPVGVLVRRGAALAGAATGMVGGLLAVDAGVTSLLAWLLRGSATGGPHLWLWFLYAFDGKRHYFPGTLDLADTVGFTPHSLIACTAFAVCLLLVTQRVAAIGPTPPTSSPTPPPPDDRAQSHPDRHTANL
jgi:hypothetical protein